MVDSTALIDAQATSGNSNITELFTTGTGDISDADNDTIYVNFYPNGCLGDNDNVSYNNS